MLGGSKNGDRSFDLQCPENHIMIGSTLRVGSKIDKISNITCVHPSKINQSGTKIDPTGWSGGNGGIEKSFMCPLGSAVNSITGTWNSGDTLNSLNFACKDIKSNRFQNFKFGTGGRLSKTISEDNKYIGGFKNGNSGNLVDSVEVVLKDMTGLEDIYQKYDGKARACNGEYQDFNPYSKAECDNYMINDFCKNNPTHDLCSCINSEVIKNAKSVDPTFPSCPQIYDAKCASHGYKTAIQQDTSNCDYLNCKINLGNATAVDSNINIVQRCTLKDGSVIENKITEKDLPNKKESRSINPLWIIFIFILIVVFPATIFLILKDSNVDNKGEGFN